MKLPTIYNCTLSISFAFGFCKIQKHFITFPENLDADIVAALFYNQTLFFNCQ
jgi:hypothetical protein